MLLNLRGTAILLFALTLPATASELCGIITDYEHLPLPNAFLNATNLLTGKVFSVKSGITGHACIEVIPEGLYSVEVSLQGFLNVRYYPVRIRFPKRVNLYFSLPFGEISEGGLGQEAVISGSLKHDNAPVGNAEICILGTDSMRIACTFTNDLGEYAFSVRPGTYNGEIKTTEGKIYKSAVIANAPGLYTNLFNLQNSEKPK